MKLNNYEAKTIKHYFTYIQMSTDANYFNTFISINAFMIALTTNKTGRIIKSK